MKQCSWFCKCKEKWYTWYTLCHFQEKLLLWLPIGFLRSKFSHVGAGPKQFQSCLPFKCIHFPQVSRPANSACKIFIYCSSNYFSSCSNAHNFCKNKNAQCHFHNFSWFTLMYIVKFFHLTGSKFSLWQDWLQNHSYMWKKKNSPNFLKAHIIQRFWHSWNF